MITNLLFKLKISTLATLSTISITSNSQTLTNIQKIEFKNDQKLQKEKHITKSDISVINDQQKEKIITFIKKGYSNYEIKIIYNKLNQNEIESLLARNYINITEYLKYPYFDFTKLDRYLSYQNMNHTKIKDTIIKVNIGLDQEFYTNVHTIENPDDILVLVNKYNQLPADYVPSDLTSLKCDSNYKLRQEAATAFDKLVEAAREDNVYIYPYSAYRSYDYQNTIYNRYVNRDGQKAADTYSARAGHSEHQTGLAVDIRSVGHNEIIDQDYQWMKENAAKYGFIIRYPENTTEITGYQEEPWQLRYVGIQVATEINELGITFDEYYQIKLANNTNQSIQDITTTPETSQSIVSEELIINPTIETQTETYDISFDTTFTLKEDTKIYRTIYDIRKEEKALNPKNAINDERIITGIIVEENGTRKMYTNNEEGNIKLEEAIHNNYSIIGVLSNGNEGFFSIEDIILIEKELTLNIH